MNKLGYMPILLIFLLAVGISTVVSASDPYEYEWTEYNQDMFNTFFGLGLTMCLVIAIVPLVLAIVAAIWIYKDAEKRGKSGILWVILLIVLTLFLNFIGFIIGIVVWLVVRSPIGGEKPGVNQEPSRRCPNCGRAIPNDANTCPYCGKNFGAQ